MKLSKPKYVNQKARPPAGSFRYLLPLGSPSGGAARCAHWADEVARLPFLREAYFMPPSDEGGGKNL